MLGILKNIKSEVLVGMLIVAGAAGVIYTSIKVTGFNSFSQEGYNIEILFDDVAGLSPKTAVRVSGIQVGRVESIKLIDNKAKVILYIFEQYQLPDDSSAQIKTLGLLGDKYIEILPGQSAVLLKNNQTIPAGTSKGIDNIIENFADISEGFKRIIEKNEKSISELIENIKEVSAVLRRITIANEQKISELIDNANKAAASLSRITNGNEEKIGELIDNANKTAASLSRITNGNEEKLNELIENLRVFSKELSSISEAQSLQKSLNNIESITKKIDTGEGTLGQLVNDTETIEKINKALDDISLLLGPAARWSYDVGFETSYLVNQEAYKSNFAITINTQKDRFYRIKLIDSPTGKVSEETTVRTVGASVSVVEEQKITDDYLIGLQIGKRFYDTQFRIGFFDSTFGIGADQFLGKQDQWQFSSEFYNLKREEGPEMTLDSTYRYKSLRFKLGAYDVINENIDRRDWNVGIGLEFNEDDLRTLGATTITSGLSQ